MGDGQVRISRQAKGRKGKPVTLISGLPVTEGELKKLAKQFKKQCGVGGSTIAGEIVIQGDQRQVLMTELLKMGYQVKAHGS
jgi:translation initiation factor 1